LPPIASDNVLGGKIAARALASAIGGTKIKAARLSAGGEVLAEAAVACPRAPQAVLDACVGLVARPRSPAVVGLGVGVPSRVIAAERRILPGGYVDLSGLGFAAALETAAGLPVVLENDATMALIAEAAQGAALGVRSAVLLTVGTGIGGAILDRGSVLRGSGSAGQLGHIPVEDPGPPCLCGRRGCLETTSSGTALARHLAEAGLAPSTRAEELLARAGDPAAERVLAAWAGPLRRAIDMLIATLAPERVLLGGGLGGTALAALDRVQGPASWYDAPVLAAALGDAAGMIGAGLAALPHPETKRVVLVNGVPASGKSVVAATLAAATGWPVLALDTIKAPFLAALPPGDRDFNRLLGRAAYAAIFDLLRAAPAGTTAIVDAWFGFQPPEVLEEGLERAGVGQVLELWCEAPPETVGARYAARVDSRPAGHPGRDYVPELVALAGRARPLGRGPVLRIDTTRPADAAALTGWIAHQWAGVPGVAD
jgi:glucokinase